MLIFYDGRPEYDCSNAEQLGNAVAVSACASLNAGDARVIACSCSLSCGPSLSLERLAREWWLSA